MRGLLIHSLQAAPLAVVFALFLLSGGCDDGDMSNKGHIKPLEQSSYFADGRSSRDLVVGTVPRGAGHHTVATTRETFDNVRELPMPLTRQMLDRGRQRYDIYCIVCHGATGEGDGMIVRRGFVPPPSLNSDKLRNAPIGHIVDAITNGYGAMYSYSDRITLEDRWAIAAYVKALQLSQRFDRKELNPQQQEQVSRAEQSAKSDPRTQPAGDTSKPLRP